MGTTVQRILLAAMVASLAVGCRRLDPAAAPRRIFLVTVDTLRADHLGAYGYHRRTSPTIDQLAAEGVRFERAVAQWPLTGPSLASLMSGLYPRTTGRMSEPHVEPPAGVTLLPEFLQEHGYRTLAVVSNRVLAREVGWNRGFDEYMETWAATDDLPKDPAELKSWLAAPRVNALALPLLERHRGAEKLFVWLHYSDPHTPYTLPLGFDNPFVSDDSTALPTRFPPSIRLPGLESVGEYVANYDANILIADRAVGQALDRARALGLLEDAVVIFTADHGESLGEHDYYFRHGRFVYNPSVRVPLVINSPRRFGPGATVGRPVELIDLYPTLCELVAPHEAAPDLPGSSLIRLFDGEGESDGIAVAESGKDAGRLLSVQTRDWKLVVPLNDEGDREPSPWEELYRLSDDPAETRNLIASHTQMALALGARMDQWLSEIGASAYSEPPEFDEETLKALGYLE